MKNITILGAGLVGSLLSILLARRGYQVQVYEKRPDLRIKSWDDGRSINLAMSERGWEAMRKAGVEEEVRALAIPMNGRMIHDLKGNLAFQPYGEEGQCIYSVSRSLLNQTLMNTAEKQGVTFFFEHKCTEVDIQKNVMTLTNLSSDTTITIQPDRMFGSDGAFSAIRQAMMKRPRFDYSQSYIEHGYKELTIPPTANGSWAIEAEALHIWPRGHFMLIALPNPDKSFTCTLFFPWEGNPSFASIQTPEQLMQFFGDTFPDILPLMPNLPAEFFQHPSSSLLTVRCYPWTYQDKVALIGDAAHAIVPFYGQGMNCGFEDCVVLANIMDKHPTDWTAIFSAYEQSRKPNADAIAQLALQNFVEMRDKVGKPAFLLRKKIDAHLHELYPDTWIPLYTMIAFTQIPYSEALAIGQRQDAILDKIMETEHLETRWKELDYSVFLEMYEVSQR